MVEYSNQPKNDDLVLGTQAATPSQAMVLGGLEGVRSRLRSPVASQQVAALSEALKYGEAGLDLVIQALSLRSWQVQTAAVSILQERTQPRVRQALLEHNPYRLFECLATLNGHSAPVLAVALSPDKQTLASTDEAETIKIWHLRTGKEIQTFNHSQGVSCIAWSLDGEALVTAGRHIHLWNLSTGQIARTFGEPANWVNCFVLSRDGQTLFCGHEDATIRIYALSKGRKVSSLKGNTQPVSCLALSPDEQILVSGTEDIKVWDCKTGREICAFKEHSYGVNCLAISPNGQTLFSGSNDYTIKVWDLRQRQLIGTLNGHGSSVLSLVVSPDSQTLISSSGDKTIKVWDLRTRKEIHTLYGHTAWVNTIALRQDGEILVSGSNDGTLKVWGLA
ncbi:MAG: WD40 repeat domain-containing protein [Coleofasciculus sp. Co-bin14]|nr:WD40 repeat domain-containing protein [Coleofasciculus sp. Co-bin14]